MTNKNGSLLTYHHRIHPFSFFSALVTCQSKSWIEIVICRANLDNTKLTKAAEPELDPPADRVLSTGFKTGPDAVVKLLPEKHRFSQTDLPVMMPPGQWQFKSKLRYKFNNYFTLTMAYRYTSTDLTRGFRLNKLF